MTLKPSQISLALAMIGIGVASIVWGNDSFLWYTIPDMPGSATLVYLCGLVALASGVGLLLPAYLRLACRVLVIYLALWLVVLKLTTLLGAPGELIRWESCGETLAILAGALCLLSANAGDWEKQRVPFVVGERGIRLARYCLIAALITFGLAHFAYADRTASLVPRWFPFAHFWVYLTGIANLAAAAGMLLGVYPRLAATLAAAMLWVFTIFVWIPRLLSTPSEQGNWTEWILSAAIAAGAWLVAETYRSEPWKVRRSF
jgi:uncharacterized membrane protein